jgi:PAS domain S-box-containing protein
MSRVLVVQDSFTHAHVIAGALAAAGYGVQVAADGQKACRELCGSNFDLVISEIGMPGMTGFELCRKIKGDPAYAHIPVILLTSLNNPLDIIHGLECGADGFVTKPYQVCFLVERVKHLLAGETARSESKSDEIIFRGTKFTISWQKAQILDLLVSTFEDIAQTNRELQSSQTELKAAKAQIEKHAHQLEGQVRSSEDKYRNLMEQANDAIFILDPLGAILEVNRRAEEILGQPRSCLLERSFESLVPAAEPDEERAEVRQLLAGAAVKATNIQFQRSGGVLVAVDLSAAVVEIGSERVILVIAHDVTDRNRLEQQLRQAQKMEAVGRLAGGIAHDFNNLLTIITGYGEILLGSLKPDDPVRELISEIKNAGDRATSLTKQLLAFSRQQLIEPRILDLNTVVNDVEKMLRRVIGEDIELVCRREPALGQVRADPGQIVQVLMNMAVNSRDAMPKGGKLTIATSNVALDDSFVRLHSEVRPGAYVMLSLADTGCGMDRATQTRIFEPFFTTKEFGKGTGLGLATVYGIVKQSNGYIYVQSDPGEGTTFRIYFPVAETEVPAAAAKAHALHDGPAGTETILLVEDEKPVREITRKILTMRGYEVLEAAHGVEALQISARAKGPIHLLITDVVMPHMGGRDLAARVSALHPETRVLFMSGYTDDAVFRHGILEADGAFLQKPFTMDAITKKVRAVLDDTRDGHSRREPVEVTGARQRAVG